MDWVGNSNSIYKTLGASNHTDKEREANDYYCTDPKAIDALLGSVVGFKIPEKVWECACGTGHLSERLAYFGRDVVSSDIVDRGYGQVADFLKCPNTPQNCNCIITNPPYKYALEFVKHSLELLSEGGLCIMFLKTTFLEGQRRWKEIYCNTPPSGYYSSGRGFCAPRTGVSRRCAGVAAVRSAMRGSYGRKDIVVRQR